ncbi:N-lysine methyltransferase KMT5A-like [Myripristis murdjan]|uniref:N-lysine methyltransferase KMT5A-like n=1 Tax=Myripristis murdjan TaxID=586833 RepID=UPI001175C9D6|nr:N-lysine methyltransferase KMT5A-like [Myripristis murdjan]
MKRETNKPKYQTLKLWTPPHKEDIANNNKFIRSVMTQRWKGLSIKDFGGDKGKGVIANRRFVKGEMVCDYHGNVIQASGGRTMLGAHEDIQSSCYLFFFKDGERDLCIDAQTFPCSCHKDLDIVGRRINHSSKKPNLKLVHILLNADGVSLDVILFKALIDIETGTELSFHYGVNRKSHRGEGLDLDWLDE